jgi:DNA polymerase III subunit delta'
MIYPWLQADWDKITLMRDQKRLPHALMLVGPDHAGIESFASELAKTMLCKNQQQLACNTCDHCRFFEAGTHPDYFHLAPAEGGGTIKVEGLREVCRSLTQKSARGGYQVVFIEQADCMQAAGANALLKTLEEPEGDVLFILWAKRVEALPATIHSRTQRLTLGLGKAEVMQSWLAKTYQLDAEKPWLKAANNRPLAVKSLQEDSYFSMRDELIASLQSVRVGRKSALDAGELSSDQDRSTYFRAMLSIAADGLRCCLHVDLQHWINEDKEKEISQLFSDLSPEQAQAFYDCVQRMWRMEQLPQALNKSLLDCQLWLEWEKLVEENYVN